MLRKKSIEKQLKKLSPLEVFLNKKEEKKSEKSTQKTEEKKEETEEQIKVDTMLEDPLLSSRDSKPKVLHDIFSQDQDSLDDFTFGSSSISSNNDPYSVSDGGSSYMTGNTTYGLGYSSTNSNSTYDLAGRSNDLRSDPLGQPSNQDSWTRMENKKKEDIALPSSYGESNNRSNSSKLKRSSFY